MFTEISELGEVFENCLGSMKRYTQSRSSYSDNEELMTDDFASQLTLFV